jgi:hypothetical protein
MPRRAPTRPLFPRPRLNKDDLLADGFLYTFGERFKSYRDIVRSKRLLAGITPDARYGKMRVRDAIIFVLTLSAAREWQGSHLRAAHYIRARHLSKFNKSPTWYMPSDVPQTQRQYRFRERNRIEALVALGFARSSGYSTHSRALWRCIEAAIRTDGLGDAPKVIRNERDVDDFFELVRGRLNYLYAKLGRSAVEDEADKVFALLSRRLQKAAFTGAALYTILHAKHREV